MDLNASTRLMVSGTCSVTYEQYAKIVSSLTNDPCQIKAFEFKIPNALKKLWSELKEVGNLLNEAAGISWEMLVKAFQEKSVFTLLKGVGFSVKKLLAVLNKAAAIPATTLFQAIDDLADTFGSSKAIQALNIHEKVKKVDELVHEHPVLNKLTGTACAGFLIWSYLHSSSVGDMDYDLDLVGSIVSCTHGNYSLADMFASKQGLKDLSVLLFGLSTGGLGITMYGAGQVARGLKFLGAHSGDGASILIALFYAAAKKIGLHLDYSDEPIYGSLVDQNSKPGRNQDWFNRLDPITKERYRRKYPGTKFYKTQKLVSP